MAVLATVAMAAGDIEHPHERIAEKKKTNKEQIKKNIEQMEAELAQMKNKLATEEIKETEKTEKNIMDRVHFKGDLRLRYESKEAFYTDGTEKTTYHNRYRLRLGVKIDLIEDLQFEVAMRSGFANPTSGNQTFRDDEPLSDYFFQSLRFNILGLAYTSANSTYKVGRQPYMMYRPLKSQLVWDNDVSMNGVNYQYKDDAKIITVGVNQPTLEEAATSDADDVNLFLAQYVHKTKLESVKLNVGAGIYYYDGLKGNIPLFGKRKGNTLDANGLYVNGEVILICLSGILILSYIAIFLLPTLYLITLPVSLNFSPFSLTNTKCFLP